MAHASSQSFHSARPLLVTGAAGRVGAVGRTVTELLLKQGKAVRAMVRNDDERAQGLREMGAEVVVGDLLDLGSMHRVIAGCEAMYFGMSVSDDYLAATINAAAVAKHHDIKAFINMSQMTLSQMSITETTTSPQHKLHWLAEQALSWSGLPVVHVRPTVFLEGFFLLFTSDSVRESNQIRLPLGDGKTSPVAAEDVARVVATLLANPEPHVGGKACAGASALADDNADPPARCTVGCINAADFDAETTRRSCLQTHSTQQTERKLLAQFQIADLKRWRALHLVPERYRCAEP